MTPRMCDGQPRHECKSGCGVDCHFNSAELARRANEHIRRLERLEAGRAHLLAISDAPGNCVDKFLDWFTALPLWLQVCYLFGAVLALGLSAVLLVGPK
jgi:hypothetical protein